MDVDQLARDLFTAKQNSRSTFTTKINEVAAATGVNPSALTRYFNRAATTTTRAAALRKLTTAIRNDMDERSHP